VARIAETEGSRYIARELSLVVRDMAVMRSSPIDALVHSAERVPSQSYRETVNLSAGSSRIAERLDAVLMARLVDVEAEADKSGVPRAVPGRAVRDVRNSGPAPAHTYSHNITVPQPLGPLRMGPLSLDPLTVLVVSGLTARWRAQYSISIP